MRPPAAITRQRWLLLHDLQRQLPRTRGTMTGVTERAIGRLERQLASGRGAETEAQRRLDFRDREAATR